MRFVLLFSLLAATLAVAQQGPGQQCQTKCNVQASDCMKTCIGDPKDAQRPESMNRLMNCMKSCESQNNQCKEGCGK